MEIPLKKLKQKDKSLYYEILEIMKDKYIPLIEMSNKNKTCNARESATDK